MSLEKKNGRTVINSTSKKAAVAALLYFPSRLEVWGETGTKFRSPNFFEVFSDKRVLVKVS
jgi:hypothetical protein